MTPVAMIEPLGAGAEIFAARGRNVIVQFSEALRQENIEGIHDLRVSIRRFRTAMCDLSITGENKAFRKLDRELKSIAAAAGRVRDHDVAIEILEKIAGEMSDTSILKGLRSMINGRRQRREEDLRKLAEHLSAERTTRLADDITTAIAAADPVASTLEENAGPTMDKRRRAFLQLVPALYDPSDIDDHHRLRIAAKRLRYSAEIFLAGRSPDAPSAAERIAEMQDHLGDMHDCDVWIGTLTRNLKKYLKQESGISPEFRAAELLLGEFVRRRAKNYREALELWSDWRNSGFLDSLTDP